MNTLRRVIDKIDNIADLLGKAVGYVVVLMMVIATIEVVMRYVFNRPTSWAWGVNVQLFALVVAMGAAYSFRHGYFVKVDVFYRKYPPRIRLVADLLSFMFAVTLCVVLIWEGSVAFWRSWSVREVYTSYFGPPAYTVKFLIPLGAFLVLLEAVAKLVSDLMPPPE